MRESCFELPQFLGRVWVQPRGPCEGPPVVRQVSTIAMRNREVVG